MKLFRLLFILLSACLLSACVKNQFSIDFRLDSDTDMPVRILYYASDPEKGWIIETVADIKQGKAEVEGSTRFPTLVYLFGSVSSQPRAILFVSRGDDISISGKGNDPASWNIKGNDITDALNSWRLDNLSAITAADSKALNKAVARYVRKNPDSKLSFLLLYLYYSRRDDEEGFLKLRATLAPEALADEDLARALSVADMPDGLLAAPAPLASLIAHDSNGDIDTLDPSRARRSLLIFRDLSDLFNLSPAHDSLKSLARHNSDAAILADICLDPDSAAWQRTLRSDTLPGVRRIWLPHGLNDSTVMALGVRRLPFYIITDSRGKQIYRGDNLKEAVATFRKHSDKR